MWSVLAVREIALSRKSIRTSASLLSRQAVFSIDRAPVASCWRRGRFCSETRDSASNAAMNTALGIAASLSRTSRSTLQSSQARLVCRAGVHVFPHFACLQCVSCHRLLREPVLALLNAVIRHRATGTTRSRWREIGQCGRKLVSSLPCARLASRAVASQTGEVCRLRSHA